MKFSSVFSTYLDGFKSVFKPWDALCYVSVVFLMMSGLLYIQIFMAVDGERTAIVELDGKIIWSIPLYEGMEDKKIHIDAGDDKYNVILVSYNFVDFIESNCPDQVCTVWGRIRYSSQSIVCLPYRVVVRIAGGDEEPPVDETTW